MRIDEKLIGKKTVFEGILIDVEAWKTTLPDGREADREIVRHMGGAAVVALNDAGEVFFVEQWRAPFEGTMLELPAGKLDRAGEDRLHCARRELLEETGLTARNWRHLTDLLPSPAYLTEVIGIFLATDLAQGDSRPDDGEFLRLKRIPLGEARNMVMRGEIADAKTVAGILMAARLSDMGE